MISPHFTSQAAPAKNIIMLSRDDVDRLLRDDSPESRSLVLEKVSEGYNAKLLNEREHEIAEHIFRLLMHDLSIRVRQMLAERMKNNDEVPRDIVLHLANDIEKVAAPILRESKALSDADLVSIVEASHDIGKLLAISSREKLSERVSGALVETNYIEVVTSLLQNAGAKIDDGDLAKIANEFSSNEEVIEALADHPDLPRVVVDRLITQATSEVAAELKNKYHLNDEEVKADAGFQRDLFMNRLFENGLGPEEKEALVTELAASGTLSPSILMTALCRGQLLFFTIALARIANVSLDNAQRLMADRGAHGFSGLYKKSGLPESMMDAMRVIVRSVQDLETDGLKPGSPLYASRLAERLVENVGEQNIDYIPYFLALIRNNARRSNF